ncbi:MAG: PEP-CTERM sorting domain-containing protein [Candidatus Ancaeobacter aquaticus]|nr:PEP-CTERM sorting domain-containing protein [Candidatus Ancaeobacter aquaticus]
MTKKFLIIMAIVVMALTASNVFAITVLNGDFESGDGDVGTASNWTPYYSFGGGSAIWYTENESKTYHYPPDGYANYTTAIAGDGSYFIETNASAKHAGIFQDFTTGFSVGESLVWSAQVVSYEANGTDALKGAIKVEYYDSTDFDSKLSESNSSTDAGASAGTTYINAANTLDSVLTIGWTNEVPVGTLGIRLNIVLNNDSLGAQGAVLVDNVSAVPEPSTVGLFGIGLIGLVGAGIRRYRKKKA